MEKILRTTNSYCDVDLETLTDSCSDSDLKDLSLLLLSLLTTS